MVLGMAFPNILGMFLLSGKVKAALNDYWGRYKSGDLEPSTDASPKDVDQAYTGEQPA